MNRGYVWLASKSPAGAVRGFLLPVEVVATDIA